ncbi:hypothetical protein DPMN_194783 [Dreissena polymorpha]|uniref:Uncharacterized protein n=1 Tax=Dreissena polymorpha TaxID=45954 RepID=A0A9D3Y5H7_DREPO|nr:hypothetical protein DPMN_194783 [Dreissena polymorpha]
MRNRSKRYRQSEPKLLTENQNLDRDTTSTGDSTTTDTMDGNLIPLLNDSDTSNGDTFVEGMPLADPQFTAKKMSDGVEVTKKTYDNMIQNEQNRNNSDNKHEKENVIEEVKIKDGDVTLVLYKVKEESFLKMEHEYKKSQSNERMENSISISNNNQHDCAETYKIKDVYNSTRTQHDASLLKDTNSEIEHTDSDKRRGSYSDPMSSDMCFESQLKTNNDLMNNARGVIEHIDELVPDGTFNYSQASTAPVSFEQKTTDLSESNTDIYTSENVLRKENIQSEKHGINEETSLETVSSECTKVSNDYDYHSPELKDSKTDVLKLDAVFHNENKQSENDFVNGETSYVTLSSEFTEVSKVGDFQNSNMLNTSTNKTEMKDDWLTSGIAITNIERKKRPPELLVTSETNLGNMNEDRGTNDKHNKSDTHTKPNVVASDKSVSNNVISNMQERNGSEKTESMETMSSKSFPMRISNKATEKNQVN